MVRQVVHRNLKLRCFWGYFWTQNISWSLHFSLDMVTEFHFRFMSTCMEIGVHLHWWFQGNCTKKRHVKASQRFASHLSLDPIPSNIGQECVTTVVKICLLSGLRSSLLRSQCAGTNLCRWYACFSATCTSEGSVTPSQSKHRSGGCQVYRTCSTSPDTTCSMTNSQYISTHHTYYMLLHHLLASVVVTPPSRTMAAMKLNLETILGYPEWR